MDYLVRKIKNAKIKLDNKIEQNKNRKSLINKDFTIISNNCWGGMIYTKYGLQYRTPTVGLYILGHDFVKLCSNFDWYINGELEFIKWEDSSFYSEIKDEKPYPVANLNDIEIYFMHYKSEEEAREKWERRKKRINPDCILFKLSQREDCSKSDIEKFVSLPLQNKICFSHDHVEGAIYVPELKTHVGDEIPVLERYIDDLKILNGLN